MEKRYLLDRADLFILLNDLEQTETPIEPEQYPCVAVYLIEAEEAQLHIEYVYISDFREV